jgi:hypothetical protein
VADSTAGLKPMSNWKANRSLMPVTFTSKENELTRRAERLILQALSFHPAARPASAGEMGRGLARALTARSKRLCRER